MEKETKNWIIQFQNGLITLSELVHKLTLEDCKNNIVKYLEVGAMELYEKEMEKFRKELENGK